jgi:hypothetical protein
MPCLSELCGAEFGNRLQKSEPGFGSKAYISTSV